jgi:hypothetical protein
MMSNTLDTLFEELKIRPMTRHMAISLFFDLPLTPAALNDFGVDTANHYRALNEVLFGGSASDEESVDDHKAYQALCERVKELDQALGNGSMLNALVRKYAPAYAQVVHFHTSWDEIFGRTEEEAPEER